MTKQTKPAPLPPGEYTAKITKIRKKRGKPSYAIELDVGGVKLKDTIRREG